MVLQRRREQHAFAGYAGETVEFWQDELDALAREESAICARLNSMDTDELPEDDRWAREAAEAEAAEAAQATHYDYVVETAHGYDDIHWEELDEPEMELGPEDWAAIQAMEMAVDSDAMDVEM